MRNCNKGVKVIPIHTNMCSSKDLTCTCATWTNWFDAKSHILADLSQEAVKIFEPSWCSNKTRGQSNHTYLKAHLQRHNSTQLDDEWSCVGEVSIATSTQLNSTRRRVVDTFTSWTTVTNQFWTSWPGEGVYSDATQLHSTSSWVASAKCL